VTRRVVALVATALFALVAAAATPVTSMPDVEDEVMCTTCGVPLNIAESPQADRQRAFIRTQVDKGLTKDEVKAVLVAEYGPDVLAMPQDEGIGRAAYLVPIVIVLGGVALLAVLLPRWRRREPAAAPASGAGAVAVSDAELARLDRELHR
jgi:cytochrome c-type biogenesis protein CcmH/NrfF